MTHLTLTLPSSWGVCCLSRVRKRGMCKRGVIGRRKHQKERTWHWRDVYSLLCAQSKGGDLHQDVIFSFSWKGTSIYTSICLLRSRSSLPSPPFHFYTRSFLLFLFSLSTHLAPYFEDTVENCCVCLGLAFCTRNRSIIISWIHSLNPCCLSLLHSWDSCDAFKVSSFRASEAIPFLFTLCKIFVRQTDRNV